MLNLYVRRAAAIPAARPVDAALPIGVIFHIAFDCVDAFRLLELIRRNTCHGDAFGPPNERIALQVSIAWLFRFLVFAHGILSLRLGPPRSGAAPVGSGSTFARWPPRSATPKDVKRAAFSGVHFAGLVEPMIAEFWNDFLNRTFDNRGEIWPG